MITDIATLIKTKRKKSSPTKNWLKVLVSKAHITHALEQPYSKFKR